MSKSGHSFVLSVRVDPGERAILQAAAAQAHTNVSDFVRRKALEAAEIDVLGRSVVVIPADHWEAFESWLEEPPARNPALEELGRLSPSWER